MTLKGICYYGEDFQFHTGSIEIENKKIKNIQEYPCDPISLVLPGLIDIHNHGNSGCDFSDGEYDSLVKMAQFHARHGVTSFTPASMTMPEEQLHKAFANVPKLRDAKQQDCARIVGIMMEGNFFNEVKKGAHNPKYLQLPDIEMVSRLNNTADGMLKFVSVAPELEGALDFIRKISHICTVSLAHTNASYEEAMAGFAAGATHLTHSFNAMPPLLHRAPGIIGAAAELDEVWKELVCDGIHVHPSIIRAAFKLFGAEHICIVSDTLCACGLTDGTYELGEQIITVNGRLATLPNGTIAGSVADLFSSMKRTISFGISKEDAIRAASYNPACALHMQNEIGSLAVGKRADLLICTEDLKIKEVYIDGHSID